MLASSTVATTDNANNEYSQAKCIKDSFLSKIKIVLAVIEVNSGVKQGQCLTELGMRT
jgi:hypothetical protein